MTYAPTRRGYSQRSVQAYANIGLETEVLSASPERLITLLFQGARAAILQARLHFEHNNIAERGRAISKAIDIVDSGLKASVNADKGGEVAQNLLAAYDIILHHLLRANLDADHTKLDTADKLLAELGQAWVTAVDPQRT